MTPLQTELSEALHALADEVAATRRTRARGEARLASTNGFCWYLFACAFASLGDRDAAFAMRDRARSMLASVGHEAREDVTTHAGLTSIFEARLDQAIDGAPYATPLPQAQRDIYVHTLSRLHRYKVDRLLASSMPEARTPRTVSNARTKPSTTASLPSFVARAIWTPAQTGSRR
jgi:hypothetical protein